MAWNWLLTILGPRRWGVPNRIFYHHVMHGTQSRAMLMKTWPKCALLFRCADPDSPDNRCRPFAAKPYPFDV